VSTYVAVGVGSVNACEIGLHRKVAPVGRHLVGHGYELFLNFRIYKKSDRVSACNSGVYSASRLCAGEVIMLVHLPIDKAAVGRT